jgi:hypothetical protein
MSSSWVDGTSRLVFSVTLGGAVKRARNAATVRAIVARRRPRPAGTGRWRPPRGAGQGESSRRSHRHAADGQHRHAARPPAPRRRASRAPPARETGGLDDVSKHRAEDQVVDAPRPHDGRRFVHPVHRPPDEKPGRSHRRARAQPDTSRRGGECRARQPPWPRRSGRSRRCAPAFRARRPRHARRAARGRLSRARAPAPAPGRRPRAALPHLRTRWASTSSGPRVRCARRAASPCVTSATIGLLGRSHRWCAPSKG